MEYDDSICFMEAENDLIWSKNYLYKKEIWTKEKTFSVEDEDLDIPF